jgi:glucose/arabinose dehydrogenase
MRRTKRRSLLVLAAKVAGAVAVVVVIVIVRPFVGGEQPFSGSNLETYASGLVAPTYVTFAPGEPHRLYVVEQFGRIRFLVGGRIVGTFLDIRSRVSSGGERGLLSVAFSPRYARDHRFYVDYTDRHGDTRVVEFRARGGHALLDSARQLLFVKQPYPNHNGRQLQFGPDGLLYVGMGDGGSAGDPQNRAQNLRERLGKLLRIEPRVRGARWQTIGYGLRNPWRFSFDRATGDLYIGDAGQAKWEEVDFRRRAKLDVLANYGWRVFEAVHATPGLSELSSFGEDGSGELYATSLNGRVYRLLPAASG